MTPYGDRRRKGEYDVGAVKTTKQNTVHDPASGGTTVQEAPATTVADPTELTLKELQAQAEAAGVATYGTKAEIAERIAEAQAK